MTKTDLLDLLIEEVLIDLTSALFAMRTRNPLGEEKACADFIHRTLTGWGVETEMIL